MHLDYRTAGMSKGFGRRETYESLTCRNPRASGDGLWGFMLWCVRWGGMRDVDRSAEMANPADAGPDLLNCRADLSGDFGRAVLHPGVGAAWSC